MKSPLEQAVAQAVPSFELLIGHQHPKAVAAAALAAQERLENERMKELTAKWAKVYNIRFLHLRTEYDDGSFEPFGGLTIGWARTIAPYRPEEKPSNVIWVSTAICAPTDRYCKWQGEFYAARGFDWTQRVMMRVPAGSEREFLTIAFMPMVWAAAGRTDFRAILGPK